MQCRFCFDVILAELFRTPVPAPKFKTGSYPLFVTWNKADSRGGSSLRGCIGNLSAMDLHEGVRKYASVSAFSDRRFAPISAQEVRLLECSVTLLHNYEDGRDYLDWQIGKHGIIIEFEDDRGERYSATYLPSVCSEQGWSQEECISSLISKAGYRGSVTQKFKSRIRLTRYQVEQLLLQLNHSHDFGRAPRQQ
uniref:AMMECR1 domain-containing protein n=1 Tax=Guillardia theta (strain CCMP2712) TaxID=905079 RepID=A0A0C3T6X9_GUITC